MKFDRRSLLRGLASLAMLGPLSLKGALAVVKPRARGVLEQFDAMYDAVVEAGNTPNVFMVSRQVREAYHAAILGNRTTWLHETDPRVDDVTHEYSGIPVREGDADARGTTLYYEDTGWGRPFQAPIGFYHDDMDNLDLEWLAQNPTSPRPA